MDILRKNNNNIKIKIIMSIWKNDNETAYAGGKKHWADVIKNTGDGNLLIWRQPEEDFNTNSTLTVMLGEEAIFIKGGVIEQTFENGTYKLSTENYPFISRLRNAFSGGVSTFSCVVYFVRKAHSMQILWGTSAPLQVEDPTYSEYLKVRAHGACKIQIDNGAKFLEKMVGNNINEFLQYELIANYFSEEMQQYIKSSFKRAIKNAGTDVIDLIGDSDVLANNLRPYIQEIFDNYGIKLQTFAIGGASVDENDAGFIHIMEMKRNLNEARLYGENWGRFQSKDILTNVSVNPGAGGVAAAGAGLGMGMAAGGIFGNMAQQMFSPMNPVQQQSVTPQPSGRFTQKSTTQEEKEDPVAKIKQLKNMLDLGAISQAEYDTKKQEILSRI
ncbi:membrane protein [Bacteroidia bacterium]|nr:membrane protein [Bacteroidia bacterium]